MEGTAAPTLKAERDIALAITVLSNDLGLDSDEALELMVERRLISRAAAGVHRTRYFAVARHLRDFTDQIRAERVI
jgi:hypothetical protein